MVQMFQLEQQRMILFIYKHQPKAWQFLVICGWAASIYTLFATNTQLTDLGMLVINHFRLTILPIKNVLTE